MAKDTGPQTLYHQLYHAVVEKIRRGELQNGDRLPPERELCRQYQVSRITVRQALDRLERDGYIVRRQGRGTFIQSGRIEHRLHRLYRLREELAQKGLPEDVRILEWGVCPADGLVAEHLRLSDMAPVYRLVRLITAGSDPLTVETSYLPSALFATPLTAEGVSQKGLYPTLEQYGLAPTRAVETLRVVLADKKMASLLARPAYDPCLQVVRTAESGGVAVEYTVNIIRSDLFEYTVELI